MKETENISAGVREVDFNKEQTRKLEERGKIEEIARGFKAIHEATLNDPGLQEFAAKTRIGIEDAVKVAEAVFKAQKEVKNMSPKELEVSIWAAQQVLRTYEEALRQKDPESVMLS